MSANSGLYRFATFPGYPSLPDVLIVESIGIKWIEGMAEVLRPRTALLLPKFFKVEYREDEEIEEGREDKRGPLSYAGIKAESDRVSKQFGKMALVTQMRVEMLERRCENRMFGPRTLEKVNNLLTSLKGIVQYTQNWKREAAEKAQNGTIQTFQGFEEHTLRARITNLGIPHNRVPVIFDCRCFRPTCQMRHATFR